MESYFSFHHLYRGEFGEKMGGRELLPPNANILSILKSLRRRRCNDGLRHTTLSIT